MVVETDGENLLINETISKSLSYGDCLSTNYVEVANTNANNLESVEDVSLDIKWVGKLNDDKITGW